MTQRGALDAVVFIALGTFVATYALLLFSSQHPDHRLKWFAGRNTLSGNDRVLTTLTLVGVLSAVWGGTGLQHHIPTWLAGLIALGPAILLRGLVLVAHNRRLPKQSDQALRS